MDEHYNKPNNVPVLNMTELVKSNSVINTSRNKPTFVKGGLFEPFNVKERKILICKVEVEGTINENKTIFLPNYNRVTDLKLNVIGARDYRILV